MHLHPHSNYVEQINWGTLKEPLFCIANHSSALWTTLLHHVEAHLAFFYNQIISKLWPLDRMKTRVSIPSVRRCPVGGWAIPAGPWPPSAPRPCGWGRCPPAAGRASAGARCPSPAPRGTPAGSCGPPAGSRPPGVSLPGWPRCPALAWSNHWLTAPLGGGTNCVPLLNRMRVSPAWFSVVAASFSTTTATSWRGLKELPY